MERLNQSFPDPSNFKDEGEWNYAAKVASVYKKVLAELLIWFDNQVETAKALEAKEKGEVKSFPRVGE